MNLEGTKFAHDPVARRVLFRMSGRTQKECAEILSTTPQNVSSKEQEQRYKAQVDKCQSLPLPSIYWIITKSTF